MEFKPRAFFTETEEPDVQGFVIIESSETGPGYGEPSYRMAEKWNRPEQDGGPMWVTYWLTEESLLDRIEADKCKQTTTVSEKQFQGVLNLAGVADQVAEAKKATA